MEEHKPIGVGLGIAFITVGVLTDVLQVILTFLLVGIVLNPVIDILAGIVFWVMMLGHGGKLPSRRGISFGISFVAEFIPGFDALPVWTLFAFYIVFAERAKKFLPPDPTGGRLTRHSSSWRL